MTTTVTVEVHCPEDIEVQVTIDEGNVWTGFRLQNGDSDVFNAYGDRVITIQEIKKQP